MSGQNPNLTDVEHVAAVSLPFEKLTNRSERSLLVTLLNEIDTAVCCLAPDMPELTKNLSNDKSPEIIQLQYNWDSQVEFLVDGVKFHKKIYDRFLNHIISWHVGNCSIFLQIRDISPQPVSKDSTTVLSQIPDRTDEMEQEPSSSSIGSSFKNVINFIIGGGESSEPVRKKRKIEEISTTNPDD